MIHHKYPSPQRHFGVVLLSHQDFPGVIRESNSGLSLSKHRCHPLHWWQRCIPSTATKKGWTSEDTLPTWPPRRLSSSQRSSQVHQNTLATLTKTRYRSPVGTLIDMQRLCEEIEPDSVLNLITKGYAL